MAVGLDGLLERELEIAHLQRAVDHSWHGVGRVVLIEGPAGIGKTTMVSAARELAKDSGMHVRLARGAELEQSFAFGIVRQLLDPVMAGSGAARRGDWLAGAAALAAPLFDPRTALGEPDKDSIYPLLHGLYWLCSNIARERPLALLIDDVHWADEPSLAFLEFLARRLEELPILLVAAVRSSEASASDALQPLRGQFGARRLAPRGLSPNAVERMLRVRFDERVEEPFARACHHATAGNPFLLDELVRELSEGDIAPVAANADQVGVLAPQRVADAVLARLGRLAPAAPPVAEAVALLGDGASLVAVAALAGLDERTALETAAALRTSDLFAHDAGVAFAHPIIRAAIYRSLHPAERALRHAQAARLLRRLGAPPEQLAAHILLADGVDESWVDEQLQLAARSALALGAPRSAVSYLTRSLELDQSDSARAALLAQLGRAEVLAGLGEASGHLEEAIRLTDDPDDRARIAITLAQLLKFTGRAAEAVGSLDEIGSATDHALDDRVRVESLSAGLISRNAHELLAGRIRALQDHGRPASSERNQFELVFLAFEAVLDNRPVTETLDLIARAGPLLGTADEQVVLPPGVLTKGCVLMYCDQLDRAEALFTEVIERSRQRGGMASLVLGLGLRGEVAYRRGELAQSLTDAREAFELARRISAITPVLALHPIGVIDNVAVERERSTPELQELLELTNDSLDHDPPHATMTLVARARLLLALGDSDAALEQLFALPEMGRTAGVGTPGFTSWRSDAALILHQLGDSKEALRLAEEERDLAAEMGTERGLGIALRACALVQTPADQGTLELAVDALARSPARLEYARALIDLGASMRRRGERAASRGPLRQGHELALRCDASRLAERARDELAASGARSLAVALTGPESLTPSERRVADLAAHGNTNRDIAQTLFITEKTVETHLGHVYDKLGVRSRHKLREVLEEPALVTG